jgi:hypothetical protein
MRTSTGAQSRELPEQRVGRLAARLRNHRLWDFLLIFLPPLLVATYLAIVLYNFAWIAPLTFYLLSGAMLGVCLLAVVVRTRRLIPSVPVAARLVDEKTAAKDRFLTLATIDVALWPGALVERLRNEAAALLERIDLRREFPYRVKRSFYWSFLFSLIAATLFHLSVPLIGSTRNQAPAYDTLSEVAAKMAKSPPLSALAHELSTLAMKLQDPKLAEQEKQTLIHKVLEQVETQQRKEHEKESQALLGEASSALQGLEQQSAQGQQKNTEKGDGSAQSTSSQQGQGEGKQSQGGGDSKGELNTERSKDMQQEQKAQNTPQEQGKEKNQQSQGDRKDNQPAPSNKSDQDTGKELTGKTPDGAQERLGRSRSEEIPQGAPPAERFYKPGEEGKEGVKGARYVTVQLPEELAADTKGEGSVSKPSKETRAFPKTPVSNAPLPAHVPEAPMEKQQLPLEYRGIIR